MDFKIIVHLSERHGLGRVRAPLRLGVPWPRGVLAQAAPFSVVDTASGQPIEAEGRALALWPDRSVKWLLVDLLATVPANGSVQLELRPVPGVSAVRGPGIEVIDSAGVIQLDTGAVRLEVSRERGSVTVGGLPLTFNLTTVDGAVLSARFTEVTVEERGRLRTTLHACGAFARAGQALPLRLEARMTAFAGSALVQVDVLLHNPNAARHVGGLWDLGDAGSFHFKDFSLSIAPRGGARSLQWSVDPVASLQKHDAAGFAIYQDSSGGAKWNSPNHVDASGALTVTFPGYRVTAGANTIAEGARATPCLVACNEQPNAQTSQPTWVAASTADFWQNFPKALRWTDGALTVGLFPRESRAPFELQGGEQKRHTVWIETGTGECATTIPQQQRPLEYRFDAASVADTQALPYLSPRESDGNADYLAYVQRILDGADSFFAKRELIDEYGWRHFGDLYADHEAVNHKGSEPFISHYNNQYDFVYGAATQFLRSGDARWLELMRDAARHHIDIDLYRTTEDKAAFNGGLFWHTDHYKPALTSTHRTYARRNGNGASYGGGPSNEQNYTSGLLHHYYLSGDPEARRAVLQLGNWVLAMDDGSRNVLALASSAPTGMASRTVSSSYHKAGRGAGNSINALLDCYALSGERRFMVKAEELIQRCIHPQDDIAVLGLSEPEYRWSYLVFLQVLGKYLDTKLELGETDYGFFYARDSLLHYADWIAANELPYKDVLHKVEIPTETWPAHDVRKCHVLHVASKYSPQEKRGSLRARATVFFNRCIADVLSFPTANLTRPLVILSVYGPVQSYFQAADRDAGVVATGPHNYFFGQPVEFIPQRDQVKPALREKASLLKAEITRIVRDKLGRSG